MKFCLFELFLVDSGVSLSATSYRYTSMHTRNAILRRPKERPDSHAWLCKTHSSQASPGDFPKAGRASRIINPPLLLHPHVPSWQTLISRPRPGRACSWPYDVFSPPFRVFSIGPIDLSAFSHD